MIETLVEYCQSNIQYFERDVNSVTDKRFSDAFRGIIRHAELIQRHAAEINTFSHKYDFNLVTPFNGYRSVVKVADEYVKHTLHVSKYIAHNHGNLLFRKQKYVK